MADDIKPALTEQDIDDIILMGGHRNAAGGIYATSVYAFAKEVAIAAVLADREERQPSPWKPLSGPGQIQPGDYVSLTSGGVFMVVEALRVLRAGASNEEVVYNLRQNHYFITQMAVDGTSHAKGVMYATAGAQRAKEDGNA